ncbi:MFS transporter [Williamsia phyllosphaerae]|uniref:MFS transporter n=1 Tax=Williamsia phyllosphaerae TaxID=885042 RepID=A0ABQ1UTM7_9NOCA|nr:MFS transporter [Williamsia phyllosphaerae]GGF26508.1 MFS transporter [Williamsia phyllosphaerae]
MTAPSMSRSSSLTAGAFVLLTTLYFAQGLPFGFFTQALPVVLRRSGYSLVTISATGILFAPWALKFLWAPYVDRYGSRRRWLLTLQSASAAVALILACLDLSMTLTWLFVGIAVVNLISATQDVVTDGLAVRLLGPRERGVGNAIQVGAYRVGMIVGGGLLLWLFSLAGWRLLFVAMAVLLIASTIPVWFLRAQTDAADQVASTTDRPSAARLATGWFARLRRPGMIAFILLVAGYKFGNSMGSALVGPFLSDVGLSLSQIALIEGGLSSVSALVGAGLGGWYAYRFGRRHALLVAGITQTAALALYVAASLDVGGLGLIVTASIAEHVFGGAATVVVFALMMDASDREYAGTDYTLIACAVVFSQGIAGFAAGVVGDLFGYTAMFGSGLVLSGVGCAVMLTALSRGVGPKGLRAVVSPPGIMRS